MRDAALGQPDLAEAALSQLLQQLVLPEIALVIEVLA